MPYPDQAVIPPRLFYTDHCALPLPPGHRFPIEKYRLLYELLEADGHFTLQPAPLADISDIEQAHDPVYVHAFLEGRLDPAAMRRIGFPWSEGLVKRTLASIGSTLAATQEALTHGWSGTLAGGTHHAFRAEGSGYCVFNDVAVAIIFLQKRNPQLRAAVVDLDVHQGDGTAEILPRRRKCPHALHPLQKQFPASQTNKLYRHRTRLRDRRRRLSSATRRSPAPDPILPSRYHLRESTAWLKTASENCP